MKAETKSRNRRAADERPSVTAGNRSWWLVKRERPCLCFRAADLRFRPGFFRPTLGLLSAFFPGTSLAMVLNLGCGDVSGPSDRGRSPWRAATVQFTMVGAAPLAPQKPA